MKKKFSLFLCLMIISIFLPTTVYADFGPKPSVEITFTGLENENYYVTLISQDKSTGPYSYGNEYGEWLGEKWVFDKFVAHPLSDGYYFLSFMEDCSDDDTFTWGYYPPDEFRILLYFTEHDTFLEVDGDYESYAFDSYFAVNVDGSIDNPIVTVTKNYDYSAEITSLIARIIGTIAVEILIALLFMYRDKKSLLTISIINIVTQIVLNILLNIINYRSGYFAFIANYIEMEIIVFIIEAVLFSILLPRVNPQTEKRYHPCWYAFTANLISFIVGMMIAKCLPGIF